MQTVKIRKDGRNYDQLRPLKCSYDVFGYADGSILFEMGNTKVLCSVSLQQGVPAFLRGKTVGWLTAEYAMLPTATTIRKPREISVMKRNDRSVEISRLIGRSLRSVVNLDSLGERTITVDCDVLQADGGTRTACITGAYFALERAVSRWLATGELTESILTDAIAAVSVGFTQQGPMLDLDFAEDSAIIADFNFVVTRSGALIEVQGTAEKHPIAWSAFNDLSALALKGVQDIFLFFDKQLTAQEIAEKKESFEAETATKKEKKSTVHDRRAPLFSLQNRQQSGS